MCTKMPAVHRIHGTSSTSPDSVSTKVGRLGRKPPLDRPLLGSEYGNIRWPGLGSAVLTSSTLCVGARNGVGGGSVRILGKL